MQADHQTQLQEDPRFICRREGHTPALKFTRLKATGMPDPETYITTCARCGRSVEFKVGEKGEAA